MLIVTNSISALNLNVKRYFDNLEVLRKQVNELRIGLLKAKYIEFYGKMRKKQDRPKQIHLS